MRKCRKTRKPTKRFSWAQWSCSPRNEESEGAKMSNYVQPDFRIPQTDPRVGVQVENQGNPIALTWPIPRHVEKLSDKDDPPGTIRAGRSGRSEAVSDQVCSH